MLLLICGLQREHRAQHGGFSLRLSKFQRVAEPERHLLPDVSRRRRVEHRRYVVRRYARYSPRRSVYAAYAGTQ